MAFGARVAETEGERGSRVNTQGPSCRSHARGEVSEIWLGTALWALHSCSCLCQACIMHKPSPGWADLAKGTIWAHGLNFAINIGLIGTLSHIECFCEQVCKQVWKWCEFPGKVNQWGGKLSVPIPSPSFSLCSPLRMYFSIYYLLIIYLWCIFPLAYHLSTHRHIYSHMLT